MSFINVLPRRQRWWFRFCTFLFGLGLTGVIGLYVVPSTAQNSTVQTKVAQNAAVNRATIIEVLEGNQIYIQNRLAKVQDQARTGELVRTGRTRAELKFNTGAVGRLGYNAVMTIANQCVQLQQGRVLVNGAVNGCTKSVVAGVRGTTYILSTDEQDQEQVQVLEGEVTVSRPRMLRPEQVVLKPGQRVVLNAQKKFGPVAQITQQEFDKTLRGDLFNGYQQNLPGIDKIKRSYEQLYPGATFPIGALLPQKGLQVREGWTTNLTLTRSPSERTIVLQLDVLDKPATTYANAVYVLNAWRGDRWVQIYSSTGARLIKDSLGTRTLPPEVIPISKLKLGALGENVNVSNLKLQAVVLLRYDVRGGQRDARVQFERVQDYKEISSRSL